MPTLVWIVWVSRMGGVLSKFFFLPQQLKSCEFYAVHADILYDTNPKLQLKTLNLINLNLLFLGLVTEDLMLG